MRLAVCIPTYNRANVVQEFLKLYAEPYWKREIDIYIYDSSESDETKTVVDKYLQEGRGLYYVHIDSSVHSNLKVYGIFKEFGGKRDYDYLWVCSDSIRWKDSVLEQAVAYMEQGYDIIIPNYRDVEKIGVREYNDCNRLFEDCAWHMTLYGAVILKTAVMLQDVDWAYLEKKYCVPDSINHSHVGCYFEKLAQVPQWRAVHFSVSLKEIDFSILKEHSGWYRDTFYVWCHCWPSMIEKLPEIYYDKQKVIKKSGVNSKILSYLNLEKLRVAEVLDDEVYREYKKEWGRLTNVPRVAIWLLVKMSPDIVNRVGVNALANLWMAGRLKLKLRIFCRKFSVIYIYGAGRKAQRYTQYLDEMGIDFKGYLVTHLDGNGKELNGHAVLQYNSDLLKEDTTGILLALNEANTREVWSGEFSSIDRKRVFDELKNKPIADI